MVTCYVDESGTDSDSPIAVLAGLILDWKGIFWLDAEWKQILEKHGIVGPIHMREFNPHGCFRDISRDKRRALFADLVKVITSNKLVSLASTLTSGQYRLHFAGLSKLSMYGACFVNLMTLVGEALRVHGPHHWPLDYILDSGNAYKSHVVEAYPVLIKAYPRVTRIDFQSDDQLEALQAADVLSWAIRRDLSGGSFQHGFEPLRDLFDEQHLNFEYKEEWMQGVAEKIRIAEGQIVDNFASKSEMSMKPPSSQE
jgi:hypothetical protein